MSILAISSAVTTEGSYGMMKAVERHMCFVDALMSSHASTSTAFIFHATVYAATINVELFST
jgi:hypothetical protein